MADILELAYRHVAAHGMAKREAGLFLEHFIRWRGRDIGWQDIVPYLPKAIIERIDAEAVGWMLTHPRLPEAPPRDGKMLATGEGGEP